jgi:hypothetical protein
VSEHRLFTGTTPHVSTAEFHADRDRAAHLEDPTHQPRLAKAAEFVLDVAQLVDGPITVSDLGCGDGGLLSLLQRHPAVSSCWGYDFQPSNVAGWLERGVHGQPLDVFGADAARVKFGTVTVATEVLEHLADPHRTLRWIYLRSPYLVASSPHDEGPGNHDACHAWAWDQEGYAAMITAAGYRILRHETIGRFQVVQAAA